MAGKREEKEEEKKGDRGCLGVLGVMWGDVGGRVFAIATDNVDIAVLGFLSC